MTSEEQIVLCALRYALGRRSYVVGDVCRYIMSLGDLSNHFKEVAITDIDSCKDLGMDCDIKKWKDLKEFLNKK